MRAISIVVVSALITLAVPALAQEANTTVVTRGGPDLWRASKLPGVGIFGPNRQRVGMVSDLLVDRDGKVKYVVVGVGGVLGIGDKKVAIPFSQVKFADRSDSSAAASASIPNTADAAGVLTGNQSNDLGGAPPVHTAGANYPDYGTVDLTRDQLKAAPPFHAAAQ